VVGQHTLDETDTINVAIREILDAQTTDWGVLVTVVELKDIQLPESMKRAMARQAEAEREKRAKIIVAEGESLAADHLGAASEVMMAHLLALQLRNLQSLVEIGVDKNTRVVFPAPLMSTIEELGAFLAREAAAGTTPAPSPRGSRRASAWHRDRFQLQQGSCHSSRLSHPSAIQEVSDATLPAVRVRADHRRHQPPPGAPSARVAARAGSRTAASSTRSSGPRNPYAQPRRPPSVDNPG
jgi:SPFH domain / Band 7 family